MKKAYELPKAEKMVFDYSNAVVASGTGCTLQTVYNDTEAQMIDGKCLVQDMGTQWFGDKPIGA